MPPRPRLRCAWPTSSSTGSAAPTPEAVAAGRERVAQLAALLGELDEAAPRLATPRRAT